MNNAILDNRDLKQVMTEKPMLQQHAALQRHRVALRRRLEDIPLQKRMQCSQP